MLKLDILLVIAKTCGASKLLSDVLWDVCQVFGHIQKARPNITNDWEALVSAVTRDLFFEVYILSVYKQLNKDTEWLVCGAGKKGA